eukprot:scaffold180593_cov28-Tisochrysis_lutea.AAC.3
MLHGRGGRPRGKWRALVIGFAEQALFEHQHCVDVRTGESRSPARDRSKWSEQPSMNAAA